MAIFSRRTIQQLIDESAQFLTPPQILRHMRNLEACSDKTIPTEWELAILVAFSKLGAVSAEPETGSTRPDLLFTPRGGSQSILLEIGTVSDKHLHQKNPFEQLMQDFGQRLSKDFPDQQLGRFHLDVRQLSPLPTYRGEQVTQKLRLPQPHEFKRAIFNRRFDRFLAAIKNAPTRAHEYSVKNEAADVTIRFDPGAHGLSAGHPVYTLAHSKTSNPVANVLHSKAKQLKSSKLPGPYGILLCDGDCDLLARQHTNHWSSFSLDEVVRHFLQRNRSIAFVSVFTVVTDNSGRIGPRHRHIRHRLLQSGAFSFLNPAVQESILQFHSALPPPARTAVNAKNHLNCVLETGKPEQGNSFVGGYSMSARTLKISLRVVQELLAGQTDMKAFQELHDFRKNPFLRNLEEGCLITKIEVEKGAAEEDDDWLHFTFGNPDPAVSPYRRPKE